MLARDGLMPQNSALMIPKTEKSGKMLFLGTYGLDGMIVGSNISKVDQPEVGPAVSQTDNDVMIQEMRNEVFGPSGLELDKLIKAKWAGIMTKVMKSDANLDYDLA